MFGGNLRHEVFVEFVQRNGGRGSLVDDKPIVKNCWNGVADGHRGSSRIDGVLHAAFATEDPEV